MNRSQMIMLIAVLGLSTFYIWGKQHKIETQEAEFEAKRYFPKMKEEDIEAISVICTDPNFAYTLKRNGDRWYLDGHLASQEKSPQLVSSLIELGTEKEIQATPAPGADKEFGLDKPTYTIALTGNGGKDLGTVLLGNRTPGANHFYGQWKTGGTIATVPAYTLGPLEEEPKDLHEKSPFPIEVTAVDRFEFAASGEKGKVERPKGADEGYVIVDPVKKDADETKINDLMYLLKDLKVARFMDSSEKTDLGAPVASYRAHEVESKVDLVVELCQPVAVTPKLRYGRRYLTDPGKSEPRAGTEERFIIEVLNDSKALQASVAGFEDRRIQKLDVDKVKKLKVTAADGKVIAVERLPQGGWKYSDSEEYKEDSGLGQRADKVLWAIRDLRYVDPSAKVEPAEKGQWKAELGMDEGSSLDFRFGQSKSGKPFVGFGDKSYLLQEDLVPALDDSVKGLSAQTSGATPAPSATPGS